MKLKYLAMAVLAGGFFACDNDDETPEEIEELVELQVPDVFTDAAPYLNMYMEEDANGKQYVVIETDNIPNHGSPYFSENDNRHEAYNSQDFKQNPNTISEQNIVYRIPANPTPAANPEATPMGPIGVAINGVAFFNQYAGPDQPLTSEIISFDQYNGHPTGGGAYHYHVEPFYLTATKGSNALMGWLADGYPVYGPVENGQNVSDSALDTYHGHEHATAEYPNGIYHYHITDADPYINGNGYYGEVGSITF